ncbi:TetR/AcrR family transcriptional regulator [Streptomonospora salina]|uniref:AcrR family transcriptional regulator n=1 Tax=Streptomonospora salina TaxID=104205 RepID=A0A841EHB4_9ACTN|nr:TetR/AcrR family transcriptional regulator [Streptomonospora salina]MBB6000759.1 AcrR family transcriptional regulator [Streptomonospora salina]
MSPIQGSRTGGRSARVQQSVHRAVRELQAERSRGELSVPLIAQRAGVTPSTIYRRWGDLQELFADVAVERLRPDTPTADTGALASDLEAWARQYLEEMSSTPGRAYVRDVLASDTGYGNAGRCCEYAREQIGAMLDRAAVRGESAPDTDAVVDHLVAPMMYRILFAPDTPTEEWVTGLVQGLLESGATGRRS